MWAYSSAGWKRPAHNGKALGSSPSGPTITINVE